MQTDNNASSSATPLIVLILAVIIWAGFQTVQLYTERQAMKLAIENQEATMVNGKKMRTQLDALAAGTKKLADQGNVNAGLIVQQLAKNGISINPDKQSAGTQN